MHFLDQSLVDANFTTKDILNFLYTGPEEWREPGMAGFDWRNVFNGADQLIRLFNQYGEVRLWNRAPSSPVDKEAFTSFPISCLSRLFCQSPPDEVSASCCCEAGSPLCRQVHQSSASALGRLRPGLFETEQTT